MHAQKDKKSKRIKFSAPPSTRLATILMKLENGFHVKSFFLLASTILLNVFAKFKNRSIIRHSFNLEYLFVSNLKSHRKWTFQMAHMSRFYVLLITYFRCLIMEMYRIFFKRTWKYFVPSKMTWFLWNMMTMRVLKWLFD